MTNYTQYRKDLLENGFCVVNNFFSIEEEIEPIQKATHSICSLLANKYLEKSQLDYQNSSFQEIYKELILKDRRLGGVVYDAIKQIPEFVQLVSSPKCIKMVQNLRETQNVGICRGGDGIRIDNPKEDKYRATWHQEYPVQFGSLNGLVFWSPLVNLSSDMGPVEILSGSHKQGFQKITYNNDRMNAGTAYAVQLLNEKQLVDSHELIEGLVNLGDLVIMDFLTIHRSGQNISDKSRWSMQFRFFDFTEEEGRKIDWANNLSQGNSIEKIYPDILVDNK